ncbi:Serine-rich adhesin for platelet [Salix suchowensis]|nr:Serine-rich adhesin for platelet [Salix suchowensis]
MFNRVPTDVMIDEDNVIMDKLHVPKLNREPQQMKRKKYNLRKSLAWDKAFFTEEGVLDPLELSTLSTKVDKPVYRGERELLSSGLDCINELPEALEDNLFKELPPNTLADGVMAARIFSPKLVSLARDEAGPASVAKRKILSASDISQSASKRSGCPRPVASSSYPLGSVLSVRKDMELGPSDKLLPKSAAHHARSKVSLEPKKTSSTNTQHPQVNLVNNCSEVIPDLVLPVAAHPLNHSDNSTRKNAFSFSQNASCNGENMQCTESHTAKASGLRMPSPSLGFFSQSKPSGSLSLLERTQTGKLHESNIPSLHKAALSNHQCPRQPSNKTSACLNMRSYAAASVNPTSHGKIKCNSELKNKEKMFQAPLNSWTCDGLNNQQQLHDIHDNQLLLQGAPCEQLEKGHHCKKVTECCLKGRDMTAAGLDYPHSRFNASLVAEVDSLSEKKCATASRHIEDRQYIPIIKDNSDYSDFPSLGISTNSDEGTQKVHVQLARMQGVHYQTVKQAEPMKLDTSHVYPVSNAESLSLCLNNGSSIEERSVEGLNNCHGSNCANAALKSQDRSAAELEIPYGSSCYNDMLSKNNESSGSGNLYMELSVGDEQLQSSDGNLTVKKGERSMPNTLAEYNLPSMIIGDPSKKTAKQTELPFPCLVTEQAMADDCGLQHDGYLLHGKRFFPEESKEKNLFQSGKDMISNVNDSGGIMESSGVLSSKSSLKQDSSSNSAGESECLHMENPLVSSVDKGLVKVASEINDMSGDKSLVRKWESSVKKLIVSSYLQRGNDANGRDSSIPENNCSTCMHDVNEDMEKTNVISTFCESDQDNQSQIAFDEMLYSKSRSLEEQREFSNSNIANLRGTIASEVESLNGIHQCEIMEQTNELAQVNRITKETVMQNALQSLEESLLSDSHNCNISPLVANKTSTVMVDGIQLEEHLVIQNPSMMIEQAPLENHEFCSDDSLLLMDNTSVELQKGDALQNVLGVGLEQGDGSCESRCFDVGTQVPPVIKNAGSDVDKKAEHAFMVDTEPAFTETLPPIENYICSMYSKNRNDGVLIDQSASLEFNSSSDKSRHHIASSVDNSDSSSFCSLNKLSMKTKEKSSQRVQHDAEVDLSDRNILLEEAQINVPQTSSSLSIEMQHELDVLYPTEDKVATLSLQKPVKNKKQDACVIKPPPNVAPFSDEWLAAFEAAGEEILTMKGGAVRNSPPDKAQYEPGPWSPVRRKNAQGIGPFDCTKFMNNNIPPSTSN